MTAAAGTAVAAALTATAHALTAAGVANPQREARLLLCLAAGLAIEDTLTAGDRPLSATESSELEALARRRADGEPMARLRGSQEFWSLPFTLGPDTLIPRPDSETLIQAALSLLPSGAGGTILDLGTGSGCLLLALLSERPEAVGLGVDIAPAACALAAENADALGLSGRAEFVAADWRELPLSVTQRRFNLVLCNPPYIPDGMIDGLAPEVARFEPRRALAGGPDGLDAYRAVLPVAAALLGPGASLLLEVGAGQAALVEALFGGAGLQAGGRHDDLAGTPRCLVAYPR